MWGNILLEVANLSAFNLGFNNTRTDVLIHLTQWQYWWWFWFSYLWGLYFLIFLRIFRFRVLKFKPRIATTFRPHGKWGDVLICLIPVSWCFNIISNSSFMLRMFEWQAESSIFTLRIRGRQWYWIYKYDLKIITDLLSVPKNVGSNKWFVSTPSDLQTADKYLHIFQLKLHNKWLKKYWGTYLDKSLKDNNFNLLSAINTKKFHEQNDLKNNFNINLTFDKGVEKITNINQNFLKKISIENEQLLKIFSSSQFIYNDVIKQDFNNLISSKFNSFMNLSNKENNKFLFNHDNFSEITRWTKKTQGSINPLRLIKINLNNLDYQNTEMSLFKFRFNEHHNDFKSKPVTHNNYLVLKQKRYKPLKNVPLRTKMSRDKLSYKNSSNVKYSGKLTLLNNSIFLEDDMNSTIRYKQFKKFKKQTETITGPLWKRMLRTKRTLVLPANTNITVVTNSYDVIHSWFIPGLGLKLDCVPGRATHHVLHIDTIGFYYGQCAEICGRYHHHMPIRLCSLPFEHFLIWWHSYGIPKLMSLGVDPKKFTKTYALYKYSW